MFRAVRPRQMARQEYIQKARHGQTSAPEPDQTPLAEVLRRRRPGRGRGRLKWVQCQTMKNYLVATIFENIADLMEIDQDSVFKIRAYRTAAETFRDLTDNVDELAERGELRSIPGIGEAIEQKTLQILDTGTCDLYERLKARFPVTITELLGLPGVGAKTVRALYSALKISNLEELREAAAGGRLRQIPRMGERQERKILEAIERKLARTGIPIVRALALTESLAVQLERQPGVRKALAAGDCRRYLEMSPGLSVVLVSENPSQALEQAAASFSQGDVLERNENLLRVRLELGEISVWADEPDFAGSALVRATGSGDHAAALERAALQKGLSFEGTRLRDGAGSPLRAPDEAALYRLLDMDYISPEIRENRGEIEAAASGALPELIRVEDIAGDLHSHTVASDGGATAVQMAQAALARGYRYLAVTDHSQSLTVARGLGPERVREQAALVDAVNVSLEGFRLLKGIEVDIGQDGSLDLPSDVLGELDWVVASVHSRFGMPEAEMTDRLVRAVSSGDVDVLGHPTGRINGARDPYDMDFDRVVDAAIQGRTALEINSFLERLDLSGENARRARDAGAKIVISTDSHNPKQLAMIRHGVAMARRGWLTRDDVLNTLPLEELMAWTGRET